MSAFNIALSGLTAASTGIDVVSNNIANANTVGFKSSPAEFADVYAAGSVNLNQTSVGENSGTVVQGTAASAGFGSIQSGALGSSNVDLTTQLVNMITEQRASKPTRSRLPPPTSCRRLSSTLRTDRTYK